MSKSKLLSAAAALLFSVAAFAQGTEAPLKLGVLTDLSGLYADIGGKGSILAARMAVEDFGGTVLGRKIEILFADHQNKPDVGNQIARKWFDEEAVDAIVDVPNSAVALSVLTVAKERNKVVMYAGGTSPALTGKECGRTSSQWAHEGYAISNVLGKAMVQQGLDTWFFITLDAGSTLFVQRETTRVIEAGGGKVVGSIKHALNSSDFAPYLLQAQASKAKAIAINNGGGDTFNSIKQARQFGIGSGSQKLVGLFLAINDVHGLGLKETQNVYLVDWVYSNLNDATTAFSKKFMAKHNAPPNGVQVGVYRATLHYLKSVAAARTTDGLAVSSKMKEMPVNDLFGKANIRADGRLLNDVYLLQVKAPSESTGPWDYLKVVATVSGSEAYRPVSESECPLLKK